MTRNICLVMAFLMLCACNQQGAAGAQSHNTSAAEPAKADKSALNKAGRSQQRRSEFTSIDLESCPLIEQDKELGMWSTWLCTGAAGYRIEIREDDLRQDIVIWAPDGTKSEIGLTEMFANGAFNSLGKTAEWRGGDPNRPDILVVRHNVARHSEVSRSDVSSLLVIRLKPPVCVTAVVPPEPGQNEQARKIADGALPDCLVR